MTDGGQRGQDSEIALPGFGLNIAGQYPRFYRRMVAVLEWQNKHVPLLFRLEMVLFRTIIVIVDAVRWILLGNLALTGVAPGELSRGYSSYRGSSRSYNSRELVNEIAQLNRKLERYTPNIAVISYLTFAQRCVETSTALAADAYVAHGVQSLPAASILANEQGGKYYCDCIETPSFFDRALPVNWDVTNTHLLDRAFESYLRHADGILTVGWTLADQLRKLHNNVAVIPNYRYAETLAPNDWLREKCGVSEDTDLVLSLSTVTAGLDVVLAALALLPPSVHLVIVGRFAPVGYRETCEKYAAEQGVLERFHCLDPLPYKDLTATISMASAGLIVLDPSIKNVQVSLPNRIFDYMFAGVPICSPLIPDIARIIADENIGGIVTDLSPAGWAETISSVLQEKDKLRDNAVTASKKYIWESVEDDLFESLGRPASVCYVGASNLRENNRTMRMARSLVARGVEVTVCYRCRPGETPNDAAVLDDGIKFVSLAN
jgi:glycosyltransferase involved in cell wall biosynthesis